MTTITATQDKDGTRKAFFHDKTTNSLFFFIGRETDKETEGAQAEYAKQLRAGHTVEAEGNTQWIEWEEIVDENHNPCNYRGPAGEEQVEGTRYLATLHNTDEPNDSDKRYKTREVLGTSWRKAD